MDDTVFQNMKSVRETKKSLPEQVADQIRELIIAQRLEIGAKIPGEFELASQLNVGRSSVREAVKILVARNVLEIKRGKGTFIANNIGRIDDPFGLAYMENEESLVRELYDIRSNVEPWITSLAAENATDEDIQAIKYWESVVEEEVAAGRNFLPADQKFHIAVAKCTGNRVLPLLVPAITYSVQLFGRMNNLQWGNQSIEGHREIIAAIEARDKNAAFDASTKHLLMNKQTVPALREK